VEKLMRSTYPLAILLAAAAIAPAQTSSIGIIAPGYPAGGVNEVKQYLGLSDAQVQSLQSIVRSRDQALQNAYNQINEKQRTLYQVLEAGTGSASQIGQLMIDVRNLEKQIPAQDGPFRNQALNVLSADQKSKLAKLVEAMQLQPTVSQAAMRLLLEYPRYIGLPVPLAGSEGISSSSGAGAASFLFRPVPPNRADAGVTGNQ
jgi:hypothetical protein